MAIRVKLYNSWMHPVHGGMTVKHDEPYIKVDPRPTMTVKHKKDLHKLITESQAEIESNSISVRHLFEKKPSRKERKKHRL